jgi:preprotein translocase subunit YajC
MEQYLLPILLVAGIIFFIIYRKNKKKKQALKTASMRKEKDEV